MQHIEESGDSNKNTDRPRSVYIATYGCQMNVRDSEVISGVLRRAGYRISDDDKKADVIIFNTCSVRQHAEDRVWSLIGALKSKNLRDSARVGTVPIIGLVKLSSDPSNFHRHIILSAHTRALNFCQRYFTA